MVIRIIIEGGALPNRNDAVDAGTINTYDGSEVLREELKKFFISVLGISDISVIVTYEGSNKNAAKVFVTQPEEDYLYTDLDDVPEKRSEWFDKMEKDGIVIPTRCIFLDSRNGSMVFKATAMYRGMGSS